MAKKNSTTKGKFDFNTIKSFEDACAKEGFEPTDDLSKVAEEFIKPLQAIYKLMVIFKARNNGEKPDFTNLEQPKYSPFFWVRSSGFGFADSFYVYNFVFASLGARLCTLDPENMRGIMDDFESLFEEFMLYPPEEE